MAAAWLAKARDPTEVITCLFPAPEPAQRTRTEQVMCPDTAPPARARAGRTALVEAQQMRDLVRVARAAVGLVHNRQTDTEQWVPEADAEHVVNGQGEQYDQSGAATAGCNGVVTASDCG